MVRLEPFRLIDSVWLCRPAARMGLGIAFFGRGTGTGGVSGL